MRVEWAGRRLKADIADFGAQQPRPEHQGAEIVLAEPLDGSTKLTNTNAAGTIVLVQRGNANFVEKAIHAQNAGATAVIVYNNVDGGPIGMGHNYDLEQTVASASSAGSTFMLASSLPRPL